VRRGPAEGTLDRALERQAVAAGVELLLGRPARGLPHGGIVSHGPRGTGAGRGGAGGAEMIAAGYVGRTDMADGAFGVFSDAVAPGGYAYLLVWGGRATVATCMVRDFRRVRGYLERTVAFFQARLGLTLREARRFGGFGGTAGGRVRLRHGDVLYAGEAAGLQDALFGFGIRCALVSGHLAGVAAAGRDPASYERACARRLGPYARASLVNRFLYDRAGSLAPLALVRALSSTGEPREWLRRYYGGRWWTRLLHPLARRWAGRGHRAGAGSAR
jgi:flavin-dependent dehydrogenase